MDMLVRLLVVTSLVSATIADCEVEHCLECGSEVGQCERCERHYGLLDSVCVPCGTAVENCLECDPYSAEDCLVCAPGKYPNWIRRLATTRCQDLENSINCHKYKNGECIKCIAGYGFNKEQQCVECVDPNCWSCKRAERCQRCHEGYTLNTETRRCEGTH